MSTATALTLRIPALRSISPLGPIAALGPVPPVRTIAALLPIPIPAVPTVSPRLISSAALRPAPLAALRTTFRTTLRPRLPARFTPAPVLALFATGRTLLRCAGFSRRSLFARRRRTLRLLRTLLTRGLGLHTPLARRLARRHDARLRPALRHTTPGLARFRLILGNSLLGHV